MKILLRTILAVSAIATSALVGSPATAAPSLPGRTVPQLPAEVLTAMQRDLGLSVDQAATLTARQARATELDGILRGQLGRDFGGSWFDAASGRLFVGVTDARRMTEIAGAGANPVTVKRSEASLKAITAELDALAGVDGARGKAAGKRGPEAAGLVGWYVDPAKNNVVVTALIGQVGTAAASRLASYGDAVRIEYTTSAPTSTSDFMDGGDAIGTATGPNCSAGFNLRDRTTGRGYLLTAGHCVTPGQIVYGTPGVVFGPVVARFFPTFDDALVRNDNAGYWAQGPWVDTSPSAGSVIVISGATDSPVGTSVCKSGITTKLTCGVITAKDETVTFDGVNTVVGLTRHSACVEHGDSGGSNYHPVGNGGTAEGVTSGARLVNGRCLQNVGQQNVSWYVPIVDSLAYYTPAFNVILW